MFESFKTATKNERNVATKIFKNGTVAEKQLDNLLRNKSPKTALAVRIMGASEKLIIK